MLKQRLIFKVLTFIWAAQSGFEISGAYASSVPDLSNYNPLKDDGYVPKTSNWQHFSVIKDLSLSVADFISDSGECVRVVVYTAQQGAMEDIKVSCNLADPFAGIVQQDEKLWYFGTSFVKRSGSKYYGSKKYKNKFIVVKGYRNLQECDKTWWIIEEDCAIGCPAKAVAMSPHKVKPNEDDDCADAIGHQSLPPMMIYSPHGDVGNLQQSERSTSFNAWEAVGAGIIEYRDGPVCFQQLVLYSYGRPLDSMKVACGHLRGVEMTDKAFYYGRTVMVKVNGDPNTFTVFYNPRIGKEFDQSPGVFLITRTLPAVCIKKTFKLVKDNKRFVKKKISTIAEFDLSPDCLELVEGTKRGTAVENEVVKELINNLNKEQFDEIHDTTLRTDVFKKLNGYRLIKINDVNLAKDMGAIIMFFENSQNEKRQVVVATATSVVLKGTIIQEDIKSKTVDSDSLVSRGDVLVYNKNMLLRKSLETFTVLVNNQAGGCTKTAYVLKSSGGKVVKEEKSNFSVDRTDTDCKNLLDGSLLINPKGNSYNTESSLSENT